jgi:sugar phosphate isomerase/epimerase
MSPDYATAGLRFGCATVALPTVPVEDAPRVLKAAGYDGIEWRVADDAGSMNHAPAASPKGGLCTLDLSVASALRARKLCDDAGVEIVGLAPYIRVGDTAMMSTVLDMAGAARAPMVRLQAPRIGRGRNSFAALFTATRSFLAIAARAATARGIKLVIEIHQHTICPSASLAAQLVAGFDAAAVGVIYDVGNMVLEGYEDHRIGFELLGDYLAHVHLKNASVVAPAERPGLWRYCWAALDDGLVDVPRFLSCLGEYRYRGWVSLEDLSTVREPIATLAHNANVLRELGALPPIA